ncbi:hypothetical protein VB005_02374 [Metarhizium brunneum]
MAPLNDYDVSQSNARPPEDPGREFLAQWNNPAGIFTMLLVIGGDVIQLACSAITGGSRFSQRLLPSPSAGDSPLLSPPEIDVKVINLDSGYGRQNHSWVLSRLVKAYNSWMPREVRENTRASKTTLPATSAFTVSRRGGLCVAVYRWRKKSLPGVPIPAIPILLYGDWTILLATAAGSLFAYVFLAMPQWREEKWGTRDARKPKTIALTRGNGLQHAIIINGQKDDPNASDLEVLAAGRGSPPSSSPWLTRCWILVLVILWLALLIFCAGITSNTWYLLGVGGIGMIHNMIIAAAPRRPEALGLPIELCNHEGSSH